MSNEKRAQLIALLKINNNIRLAAEEVGVNYENAKAIYRTYRLQNRVVKVDKKMLTANCTPHRNPALRTQKITLPKHSTVLKAFDHEAELLQYLVIAKTPARTARPDVPAEY